jgi:HEAT repeat protein
MCGAVFSLRDDMQGKKVRCTKCEQVFTVGAGQAKAAQKQSVQSKPAAPVKKSARDDDDEVSTAKKNRAAARRGRDDGDDDSRPRKGAPRRGNDDDDVEDGKAKANKKKRVYHDDDDDDAPRNPSRKKKSGGGAGLVLAIVGGVSLVVLLACGGLGYWFVHSVNSAVDDVNDQMQQAVANANNGNPPAPPPGFPNPPPGFPNPPANFPNPPPGFPNVGDPFPGGNPKPPEKKGIASVDDALRDLRSEKDDERRAAVDWLAKAPLDRGRQDEVARALNPLLKDPDNGRREKAVVALKVWVTKDNLDGLIQILNEGNPERWHHENGLPRATMEVVAKLQSEKSAEPIWRYRAGPSGNEAETALRAIGQAAGEKAALLRFDDPNEVLRNSSRSLLVSYGTRDALKLKQVASDLKSDERNRRNAGFDYLAISAVVESERPTIAPALNNVLGSSEVSDNAMRAVEKWAAADNVPALVKAIGDDQFPHRKRAMALLGRLKDPRAAEPLAEKLTTNERRDAADALIALGPAGKPAVEKYATNPDKGVQKEVDRVLASYGTDTSNLGLTRLLTDLESPDGGRRANAARGLAGMKPDPAQQEKVIKALLKDVEDDMDKGIAELSVKAIAAWGTKDNAAGLIKIIENRDKYAANVRHTAMDVLAKWKAEDAIKPIALNIGPDGGDRDRAGKALIAMGPDLGEKVEAVVLEGLSSTDEAIVLECVKVLGAVGTNKSVKPLNNLAVAALRQKKTKVVTACQRAVLDIQNRK